MAQTSFPFENLDTSESEYSYLMRNIGQGVVSGRGNELEPYGDGVGLTVKVKGGEALVRGHYFMSTGTETLSLAVADPSLPRFDAIVLRLDPTANSILLAVKTGTPDSSPALPALVQTDTGIFELLIAKVSVSAGAVVVSAPDVTDQRLIFSPWTGSVNLSDVAGLSSAIDAIDASLALKAPLTPTVSAKTGPYTLVSTDNGQFITCDGTFTITIPGGTFAAGDRVDFVNIGAGVITIAGSGVTVSSVDAAVTIDTQWAGATFFFTSSSAGVLIGKLA